MRNITMHTWLDVSILILLLTPIIHSLAHGESQVYDARGLFLRGNKGFPPVPKMALVVNASAARSSQTLLPPLVFAQTGGKATTSTTALSSTSTTASTAKIPVAAEKGAAVATNNTTTRPGNTGALSKPIPCGAVRKRSWTIRGRSATHVHVRECLAPEALQPATALAPESNAASGAESKPRPASSPEPQAAELSQQADSQQAESQQPEPQEADSQQTDSHQADVQQVTGAQIQSQQINTQQADNPPVKGAPSVDSEPGTPNVTPTSIKAPIIVQGQTVPANGQPITVNNQPISLASGYIHVGTLSTPIPMAQMTPPTAQPIVAGTLTFQPALPSLVQVGSSPFVVGGFTFSAAQAGPYAESNKATDEPEARPVVVGGKIYAPLQSTSESEILKEAGKTAEQGISEPASSQEQSDNLINNYQPASDTASNLPGQADSKPIVIAGTTYTPVTTPSPQQPSIFSFAGTSLTQGGSAITVSGTLISLGPSGVMIGTSSIPLSPTAAPTTTTTSLLPIGSEILTALHIGGRGDAEWGFEIDHSTLLPGSPGLSISGTLYSLDAAGSVVIRTSTIALATAGSNDVADNALTAGGETFTPLASTAVLVDGTPLSIGGPAITGDGTKISLASNGLVVGSSTYAYATPAVVHIATLSSGVVSGSFSTGILPSVGAMPASAMPSVTGNVSRSSASVAKIMDGWMLAVLGVFTPLCVMVGIM